jgi:4-hydroxy-3-polyprenylbenzoate decarboxylase
MTTHRIIVGITGASGAAYARRLVDLLDRAHVATHLVASNTGRRLLIDELEIRDLTPEALIGRPSEHIVVENNRDLGARIASGSFRHDGMIVVPCSSNTLAAIATGVSTNLLQRAAAVTLKERRTLVLYHRETPLSLVDARNMVAATEAGAIVAPASPGFYLKPRGLDDIIDFMAGRLLDLVGIDHDLDIRWEDHLTGPPNDAEPAP